MHSDRRPSQSGTCDSAPSRILSEKAWEEIRQALRLSPREMEISRLMMDGLSLRAMGRRLGCSPHTVSTHTRRIFRKLHVASRSSVIAVLFRTYVDLKGPGAR